MAPVGSVVTQYVSGEGKDMVAPGEVQWMLGLAAVAGCVVKGTAAHRN